MAKITITGNVASVISTLTKDQLDILKKYDRQATQLTDEDGNMYFAIDYNGDGCGSINRYGVTFCGTTFGDGKLCCTVKAEREYESAQEFVIEQIGMAATKLNEVENNAAVALVKIEADIAAVCETINVAE